MVYSVYTRSLPGYLMHFAFSSGYLSPMACIINLQDRCFTQYHNILLMHHEYEYALATKDHSSLIVWYLHTSTPQLGGSVRTHLRIISVPAKFPDIGIGLSL